MKRILSFVLSCIVALSVIAPSLGVRAYTGDYMYKDIYYNIINDSTITITDCNESAESVDIPATIAGYPVTAIESRAFYNCGSLTSVTIPNSVTSISCC